MPWAHGWSTLAGCAELLGLSVRRLRKLQRERGFPAPAGEDGGQFWRERDVWKWAARQGHPLASRVPLQFWPEAQEPAEFLGAVRVPARYQRDDVALRWATVAGVVAVVWRPDDPIMLRLSDLGEVPADVLVGVDPDFGIYGPGVHSLSWGRADEDDLSWSRLALILGQPLPYWPYRLRDPDLIEVWQPDSPSMVAPARPDLDTGLLMRMAAMFDPEHATHRMLTNLVRVVQDRASRDALQDVEIAAETARHWSERHDQPVTVVAAEPLVIGDLNADPGDVEDTVRRIGWIELLGRTDTLSWACVQQALAWDGGTHFPFSRPEEVNSASALGREWMARLEPATARTAEFARISQGGTGEALVDPLTGAPAVRLETGRVVTAVPQRLPATSPLAEVILGPPIWVRTADGAL